MQNPTAALAPQNLKSPSSRYVGMAFAVAINAGVIWAIVNGLNIHPGITIAPPTTVEILPQTPPAKPVAETPHLTLLKPTTTATTVVMPKPIIDVQQTTPTAIAATTQPTPPNPPMANSSVAGLMNTHTIPPYPAGARRLGQEGTVTLLLSIGANGAVTNAQVKTSSGYEGLDETAIGWVIAHWRYKPAMQSGAPVASTSLAAVKFDLREAR
ncbi:MAG TPA: TonB family protein [Rhizomicrobium sp.]|jgi:protein TonB